MSESVDWGLWLPVIGAVSGFSAICSVGIVLYCYCRVRDNLSPVGSGGGAAHVRDEQGGLSSASRQNPIPESMNRASRVRFQGDDSSTNFPGNQSHLVKFEDAQQRSGKTAYGFVDEEVSFGTTGRIGQTILRIEDEPQIISRNNSKSRSGDTALGRVLNTQALEHQSVDGEGAGYDREDHIVDHEDGSQDVFV